MNMKVKALVSFSSVHLSMYNGEIRDIDEKCDIPDLLKAKFIEEIKETPKRSVTKNENKRNNSR